MYISDKRTFWAISALIPDFNKFTLEVNTWKKPILSPFSMWLNRWLYARIAWILFGFCKTPANNLYTSSSLFYIIRSLTLLSLHIQSFRRVALKNVTQQNEDAATAQTKFLFNVTVRDGLSCTPFQVLSRILFSLSLNLYVHTWIQNLFLHVENSDHAKIIIII